MRSSRVRKNQKSNVIISRKQLAWYYLIGGLIVIGSVMSFGLVAFFAFDLSRESALAMVFMIIPMGLVMFFAIHNITKRIESKLGPLVTGIHRVADGDLSTQLDTRYSGEYLNAYKEFNHMVKELKTTKDEMESFVNEFTHEFKTPITSISGFAELLVESGPELTDEERNEYLKIIEEQSKRLTNLSQNSLLLSKVEATQILTGKVTYNICEQIQQCVLLFIKQAEMKNIAFDIPEDSRIEYFGNKELMEQVWINLIGNAIKFTPDGGLISITEEADGNEIRIAIRDSGEGMSSETIDHIFEKYYQHDLTSVVKGNGIGLAIVHRVVELSEGRIEVESKLGEGSKFTVILPTILPTEPSEG